MSDEKIPAEKNTESADNASPANLPQPKPASESATPVSSNVPAPQPAVKPDLEANVDKQSSDIKPETKKAVGKSKSELKAEAKARAKAEAQAKAEAKAETKAKAKSGGAHKHKAGAAEQNDTAQPVKPVAPSAQTPAEPAQKSDSTSESNTGSEDKNSVQTAEPASTVIAPNSPSIAADAAPVVLPSASKPADSEHKADAEAEVKSSAPKATPPATEPKNPAPDQGKIAAAADPQVRRRRKKLDRASKAARRDAHSMPARRRAGAVVLSLAAVIAAGGVVAAGSLLAPQPHSNALPAAVTSLPAGDATSVCAATPQLLKGVDGTDPQFAAGGKVVSSNLRAALVSDLGKRVPGATWSKLGSSELTNLSDRISDEDASKSLGADSEGLTGRVGKLVTKNNLNDAQVFGLQPLGELPSWGSAMRSYQAKDGDLAGLAASTCQAPASNWRFTGLQTNTGATSVLHLTNPTHTTAQVAIELRGPEGLIDTSTLQNIVIAPGTTRPIVLGGYAQNLDSVSANISSLGGKITASVQQAALRGLTPSGVDLVGSNAAASNTQVIPGVWIGSKDDQKKLTAEAKNLVPQLHISATGSRGAGFTVKVLGSNGEVAADFGENLAVSSNATTVIDLSSLNQGVYSLLVESDAPVTSSVRMVRGSDPKKASDTAWAVSSQPLTGTQVAPLSANGNGEFSIAAPVSDASIEAVVVDKDGKLSASKKLEIKSGQSITFKPKDVNENAQAVIFSGDSNAYIGQLIYGSDSSLSWAAMPMANAGRDGIVVNVGG